EAVVRPRASGPRLRHTWTVPVRTLGERPAPHRSAGGGHGAAVAPVADRVVLGAGEAPPAAQVGADRPHRRRLGGHPGEEVLAVGPVQRGTRRDPLGGGAGGRALARQPAPCTAVGCSKSLV